MEAIGAFLEAAKENRLYAYWCVLLFDGLRPAEALRWEEASELPLRVDSDQPGDSGFRV